MPTLLEIAMLTTILIAVARLGFLAVVYWLVKRRDERAARGRRQI
jgi:hypothetical protein